MKISIKATHGVSGSNEQLLHVVVKQEYNFIVTAKKIDFLVKALASHADRDSTAREYINEWITNFRSFKTFLVGREGEIVPGATLSTDWQELPFQNFELILQELKRICTSGFLVAAGGTAPNYALTYSFGTFSVSRPLELSMLTEYLRVIQKLQNSDPQILGGLLEQVALEKIEPLTALEAVVEQKLDGSPLAALSILFVSAVLQMDIAEPVAPIPTGEKFIERVIVVGGLVVGIIKGAGEVAESVKKVIEGATAWQALREAKAKADMAEMERARKAQENSERDSRRVRGSKDTPEPSYGGGGAGSLDADRSFGKGKMVC